MIYHISGNLKQIYDDFIVVNVQGVGYQVYIPSNTKQTLPDIGHPLDLYTFHYIREDQQLLFGFQKAKDRSFFNLITSVSGVGPKLGIKIMSANTSDELISFILKEDLLSLTSISGLGKKTSEKIILDLKDKLPKLFGTSYENVTSAPSSNKQSDEDLMLALKTLGYSTEEIKKALKSAAHLLTDVINLEGRLKILLSHL